MKSCHWDSYPPSANYSFGGLVFSTRLTFEQLRARSKFHHITNARVDGRPAKRFGVNSTTLGARCDLAWRVDGTTRWASIVAASDEYQVNSCKYVDRWAKLISDNSPG